MSNYDGKLFGDQHLPRSSYVKDDNPRSKEHTEPMNDITREELNAKLETIETRMDARVAAVSS